MFSTSGNMNLPRENIAFIESEMRKDVYNAGLRPFLNDVYRFLYYQGTCVLLHYHWLNRSETGGSEFGITKAFFGVFENHPMEYCNFELFSEETYFCDYPDANGQSIHSFKQLYTFKKEAPPIFKAIEYSNLFGVPAISFEQAGSFAMASDYTTDRVRAAIQHLVRQYSLPENQRLGIVYRGTTEQIRYLFAAIGYAFSAKTAQSLSFAISLPPLGYSYSFSKNSLVGWNIEDPDLAKISRMPANLIMLESLPVADDNIYYTAVTKYDENHHYFINDYLCKYNDINIVDYPEVYHRYAQDKYSMLQKNREMLLVQQRTKESEESARNKLIMDLIKVLRFKTYEGDKAGALNWRKNVLDADIKSDGEKSSKPVHRSESRRNRREIESRLNNNIIKNSRREAEGDTRNREKIILYDTARNILEVIFICLGKIDAKEDCIELIKGIAISVLTRDSALDLFAIFDILVDYKTKNDESAFACFCLELCKKYRVDSSNQFVFEILVTVEKYYSQLIKTNANKYGKIFMQTKTLSVNYMLVATVFSEVKLKGLSSKRDDD